MHAARGILTARGGMTSHAAVVARGMGRPCVSGAGSLAIDGKAGVMGVSGREVREGDVITIDGASGEVTIGPAPRVQRELARDIGRLTGLAANVSRLKARATPAQASAASTTHDLGAAGYRLGPPDTQYYTEK